MICYDYTLYTLASFDWRDAISQKTGKEFSYTYYLELNKKSRNLELSKDEYYDFEISRLKYDINQN